MSGDVMSAVARGSVARTALWVALAALPACTVSTFEGRGDPSRAPSAPLPPGFTGQAAVVKDEAAKEAAGEVVEVAHVLVMHLESAQKPEGVERTREEAAKRAAEVLAKARAGEPFEKLAGEYSDEPGAAERGGKLPPFGRGAMVPEFEDVAFGMKPGALAGPVETEFGFHIIKRLR